MLLESFFEIGQRLDTPAFIFADPAVKDFAYRHRVEIVQFFAAAPDDDDEVSGFEEPEMLGDGLAGHVKVFAELAQSLAVICVEHVEQPAPGRISERLEHLVFRNNHNPIIQPNGCINEDGIRYK